MNASDAGSDGLNTETVGIGCHFAQNVGKSDGVDTRARIRSSFRRSNATILDVQPTSLIKLHLTLFSSIAIVHNLDIFFR